MKKWYIVLFLVIACLLVFQYKVSGISGVIGYVALFLIGVIIAFIIREIRNPRSGRKH